MNGKTLARDWTPAESASLSKPPPPPKKYLTPSFDPNLGDETKLVGEQTAPGPFRYADPDKHLLGFDYWMAGWANGKGKHEASPSGAFTPVFDRDQPVAAASKRVMAKDGYAVGGVVINTRVFVNAFKLICMRVKADGSLDPTDTYETGWEGTRTDDGKDVTLSGDGRKVIGIVVRKGGVLNSLGLIYAK